MIRNDDVKALIIDKQAVKHNVQEIKRRADNTRIIANLSGDGQGMGLLAAASILREDGVNSFAVSEVSDAVLLRENNFEHEEILMLRSTADKDELLKLVDHSIICTVGSYDAGIALNALAESRRTAIEVKIEIDTGFGGFGFMPSETDKIANLYRHMGGLAIAGMYTRLAASWKSKNLTRNQLESFERVVNKISDMGYDPGVIHALDSAALFKYDYEQMDAVCVGSAIIGRIPGRGNYGLIKVGYIEADIEEIDWVTKGEKVGFGSARTLRNNTKIGVISAGWTNGVGLSATGAGENTPFLDRLKCVLKNNNSPMIRINGIRAKTIGQVGLTYLTTDITDINCSTGDKAIIECDPRLVKGLDIEYR